MVKYVELPVDTIYYDKAFNCREEFTPQSCLDLAQSIKQHGLQIPIVVQPASDVEINDVEIPDGYEYRLIVGHRRFIAITQLLGWSMIPAQIQEGISEKQAKVLNLIENLERKNISFYDEAKALRIIFPKRVAWIEMARVTSKSDNWCRIRWMFFTLPENIQQDCITNKLGTADITMILAAEDKYQLSLAQEIKMAKTKGMNTKKRKEYFTMYSRVRRRVEIQKMLADLMCNDIKPSAYRALAWAAGDLTSEEFLKEPYE